MYWTGLEVEDYNISMIELENEFVSYVYAMYLIHFLLSSSLKTHNVSMI